MYFAYSALLLLVLLLSSPWWLLQMLRHGKYRAGWRERLGIVPKRLHDTQRRNTIWIHAVSVGEVLAVSRVVEELKARLPECRVVVSTTTDTGQRLARQRFGENNVFYFPLDVTWAVNTYLRVLRPSLVVLAESEFWPNLLHRAKQQSIPVAVVNARVSDRSFPRYLRFRPLLRRVMGNVDLYLAQSGLDAGRLLRIGAPAERVKVGGNLKFEVKPPTRTPLVDSFAAAVRNEPFGPVLVAGSTLDGEETIMLQCFAEVRKRYPSAVMVLAPRHPERFAAVASLLETSGLPWRQRSHWDGGPIPSGQIFLLDTIGELACLYQFADVAIVGGSFIPKGGHNILEAAQFGVAILVGPYTENFRDIIQIFQSAEALKVAYSADLTRTVLRLLEDDAVRASLGDRAREVMQAQQGATERTVGELMALLPAGVNA